MTKILKFGIRRGGLVVLSALGMLCSSQSFAQTGTLHGGQMALSANGHKITVKMSAVAPSTWTFTLPNSLGSGTQFLYDDGTGTMQWGVPIGVASTNNLLYNVAGPQSVNLGTYDFFLGYTIGNSGPDVGGIINVIGNGTGQSETGFTITADDAKASTDNGGVFGLVDTVYNAGTGTTCGLCVTMAGNAANDYAFIAKAGEGSVGINTLTPTQELEVDGDILISGGTSGLKINEWVDPGAGAATPGTMGIVTLAAGTKVVKTSSATANSRIFVTIQSQAGGQGKIYVSAIAANTFTITSTNNTETSAVAWWIVGP